jgi:hypothetical protein
MAAEFYISFRDPAWRPSNLSRVEEQICQLGTFAKRQRDEFWLLGHEARDHVGRWSFDVRLFTRHGDRMLLEISAHPKSVEEDLSLFLSWLRGQTEIAVTDEDGDPSGW